LDKKIEKIREKEKGNKVKEEKFGESRRKRKAREFDLESRRKREEEKARKFHKKSWRK
jgi:hypothetical protein